MSGVSDKARFYLEQAIPQLQEFEQKKIFTKDEIRTLVKKRSDFEHKILARGSRPIDFARYVAWEISLEKLRQKRCKRLKVKGSTAYAGQARVFLIFERATRKHLGDLALWMSYLQYTREVKATKKFKIVLTSALRIFPTKAGLWLYAAKWALEAELDMNGARSYMQRGTRFCTRSKVVWIEYAKLEMIYLAKIGMRRKILGIDNKQQLQAVEISDAVEDEPAFSTSEDMIPVPDFSSQSFDHIAMEGVEVDTEIITDPATTPALNGAIPMAIFDDARKQSFYNASVGEDFINMFAAFPEVACLTKILQHVLDTMTETYPTDLSTINCFIRQPILGIDPMTAEFPVALASALDRLKVSREWTTDKEQLSKKMVAWIEPILALEGLDADIGTVLRHILRNPKI